MYFLSLALCLFIFGIRCSDVPVEDGISVLSDATFKDFIDNHPHTFVEFYAPWCGHCKSLAPVYIQTAASLQEANANVVLAKVDCTEQKLICNDVQGYPTLKLFSNPGKIYDYDGDRTEAAITAYLLKKTGPASIKLSTASELSAFLEAPGSKVIAYLDDSSASSAAWGDVASDAAVELFSFAHVDPSIAGDKRNTVELSIKGKETVVYTDTIVAPSVVAWILENGFPLVETLSQESWNRATTHPTSKYLAAVFFDKNEAVPDYVESIAAEFKGQVIFTSSDSTQILERWGGSGTFLPSAVVLNFNGAQPELFTFDESSGTLLNAESLRSFIEGSLAGTYETNVKSEKIPDDETADVRTLVAKNFQSVVDNTAYKVVFVEFYAPWCGHCKKLAPVLDQLGAHFSSHKNVVIAKFDATANTVRKDIKVEGFPTIIAFQNGALHKYAGGHDLESMITFIDGLLKDNHEDL